MASQFRLGSIGEGANQTPAPFYGAAPVALSPELFASVFSHLPAEYAAAMPRVQQDAVPAGDDVLKNAAGSLLEKMGSVADYIFSSPGEPGEAAEGAPASNEEIDEEPAPAAQPREGFSLPSLQSLQNRAQFGAMALGGILMSQARPAPQQGLFTQSVLRMLDEQEQRDNQIFAQAFRPQFGNLLQSPLMVSPPGGSHLRLGVLPEIRGARNAAEFGSSSDELGCCNWLAGIILAPFRWIRHLFEAFLSRLYRD